MAPWSRMPEHWRTRLPLLLVTALVATWCVIAGLSERGHQRQRLREVVTQAEILAESVGAALVFDDREAARTALSALRANPEIESAGVYDASSALAASFAIEGQAPPNVAGALPTPGAARGRVAAVAPVTVDGERVGTVYLRSRPEPFWALAGRLSGLVVLLVMGSLLLAVIGRANAALRTRAEDLDEANRRLTQEMAEREKAEDALRQSQKMEAVGRLTGGIAHDFNNLLMVASSGLDLLDRTKDPVRREKLKNGIRQAVDRGASLTRQMLAFSRRAPLKPEVVDLTARLEGVRVLLERGLGENVGVELNIPEGVWPVEIDPGQLDVALLNIAVNARDAMPRGGRVTVTAENRPIGADGLDVEHVRLAVADEGEGIAPELLHKVFEPFFTTKGVGKGTGLGLSQVYGFARSSAGDVRIESEPGVGTTVSLLLPRTRKPLPVATAAPAVPLPRARGRILLVEDDDNVAALVQELMAELGYEVERAPEAESGLKKLERADRYEMVFSDMVMPGRMDGMALARTIAERWPDLPVLLTTGYSEAAAAALAEGFRVLPKPYRLEALAAELAAAREGRARPDPEQHAAPAA